MGGAFNVMNGSTLGARTFTDTVTIQKTAQASTAEDPILRLGISDAMDTTKGRVDVANASSTDATFTPWLRLYSNGTNPNHVYAYIVTDTGTQAALNFDGRTNANGAIATRPISAWNNNGTRLQTLWPTGLNIGATTSAAPGCMFQAEGTIRATTQTAPSTGEGAELFHTASEGYVQAFNRTGGVYQNLNVRGLQVKLIANGTTAVTASSTAVTSALPVIFASYTLATLPAAASFTRAQIWVSDMTGGAQYAYSDGTNWRRVSDNTVAS